MSELLAYLVENEKDFRRARLPALYSDFAAQRTLNPDGFAANLAAWIRGLSSAALAGRVPARSSPHRNHFTVELDDSLLRSLESKQFGLPLALGTVLQDAVGQGNMMPLQTFLKAQTSVIDQNGGWTITGLPLAAIRWGLRQAGLIGTGGSNNGKMPKGLFVILANLEEGARLFSDKTRSRTSRFERTFSKADFRQTFEANLLPGQTLSEADFEVMLKYLSRDKALIATDGTTIKLRSDNGEEEDARITEEDAAIGSLKELMEDLTTQTETLSARIDQLATAAQEAVAKKNRVAALAALKSKKLAEGNLAKRFATLGQLEEVAAKIEQASDNVALVRVMQSSTTALRSLNDKVGSAERVDEVLDELREQMGQVDEVGNIIAEAGQGTAAAVDESEVDEELERMVEEERLKEEEKARGEREAKEAVEAEETRRRLAELEKLGPVGQSTGQQETEKEPAMDPPTPVTATANELGDMSLDKDDPVPIAAT